MKKNIKTQFQPQATFMKKAIALARQGMRNGQSPFGAVIACAHRVISASHNCVWKNTDITAHAEIQAIRKACAVLKTIDLSSCVLYSTCEPCPMCMSAAHWARIPVIIFGARIADAGKAGFNELYISSQSIKKLAKSNVTLIPDFMAGENKKLFDIWLKTASCRAY